MLCLVELSGRLTIIFENSECFSHVPNVKQNSRQESLHFVLLQSYNLQKDNTKNIVCNLCICTKCEITIRNADSMLNTYVYEYVSMARLSNVLVFSKYF